MVYNTELRDKVLEKHARLINERDEGDYTSEDWCSIDSAVDTLEWVLNNINPKL